MQTDNRISSAPRYDHFATSPRHFTDCIKSPVQLQECFCTLLDAFMDVVLGWFLSQPVHNDDSGGYEYE